MIDQRTSRRASAPVAFAGLLAASLALAGCSADSNGTSGGDGTVGQTTGSTTGSTGGGTTGGTTTGGNPNVALYTSLDQGGGVGTVIGLDDTLSTIEQTINTGLDGEITVNNGTLYQAGLLNSAGTVRALVNIGSRGADVTYDDTQDISAPIEMVQPQGIVVGPFGYEPVVADAQTDDAKPAVHLLTRFKLLSTSKQAPSEYQSILRSTAGGSIWAVYFDIPGDRLFATRTDGTVDVFDNFIARSLLGEPPLSHTITPGKIDSTTGASVKISKNLHGIAYNSKADILFVSDVGDTSNTTDGAIYVIKNASRASDSATNGGDEIVVPSRIIAGSMTELGNPVGLSYSNNVLAVAEKANNLILEFKNPALTGGGSNVAPDAAVAPSTLGKSGSPISVSFP